MSGWLRQVGVSAPSYPELISAGAAAFLLLLAWGVSLWVGRRAGPYLSRRWARFAGARIEGISDRMCSLVRYAVAALILAIAIKADRWPDVAEFILGFGLALAAALFVKEVVRGLHFPRWVALSLAGVTFVSILADVLDGLAPITRTLDRVGFNAGDTRFSLLAVLKIAIALAVLYAVLRLLSRIIFHSIRRSTHLDATQQLLTQKLVGVAMLVAAFFIAIDIIGIDLTALAVFSGAFGLAVGFGLQKTFGNLIAGIILLMDRSIKPGDVIVVGDSFGHVSKIGVRAVSIVTRDGKEHLIPNENLMTQEVENWSYSTPNVRVHIPVGVAYGSDLELAQRLMIEAAKKPSRVLNSPEPSVWLRAFGESAIEHDILVWIADPEAGVGNVQSEILNAVWKSFQEHGVEVPFPQRDIHIKDWPGPPPGA